MQQVEPLHQNFDKLQIQYGEPTLSSIYGTGEINSPNIMFIFMNPTGRNISSNPQWKGLRAPWLGTKQIWDIFYSLGLLENNLYEDIRLKKTSDWDELFAESIYDDIQRHSVYITNLAKCTQIDARPLNNHIFKDYLDLMYKEIQYIKPKKIVSFGNQVSSILLNKNISVSNFKNDEKEILKLDTDYYVYPTYYPVGQGRRNMPLAIERIKNIIKIY